jgi:hypothetical protein
VSRVTRNDKRVLLAIVVLAAIVGMLVPLAGCKRNAGRDGDSTPSRTTAERACRAAFNERYNTSTGWAWRMDQSMYGDNENAWIFWSDIREIGKGRPSAWQPGVACLVAGTEARPRTILTEPR